MASAQRQSQIYAELFAKHGRVIAAAFLRVTAQARNNVDFAALERAIDFGDVPAIVRVLNYGSTTLLPITEEMRAAFVAGGLSAADIVPSGAVFGFDARNLRAENWIFERAGTLIQGIEGDTIAMVRTTLLDQLQHGRSSRSSALDMVGRMDNGRRSGGFIGLTDQQGGWVRSARSELADLNSNYFTRTLRDRRYDAQVRRAIKSGTPLTPSQINTISGRYSDRMLKFRGDTIARNEAHTALSAGQNEGFSQLVEDGKVDTVTKRWQHNDAGQEFREDHVSMGMAPARSFDEPFVFDGGIEMQYPHDPAGTPVHSIGCRCIAIYRPIVSAD